MNTATYKFKKGDRVRLIKELDWASETAPRPGDIGTIISPGINTCRVGFALEKGVVHVAPLKLEKVERMELHEENDKTRHRLRKARELLHRAVALLSPDPSELWAEWGRDAKKFLDR